MAGRIDGQVAFMSGSHPCGRCMHSEGCIHRGVASWLELHLGEVAYSDWECVF